MLRSERSERRSSEPFRPVGRFEATSRPLAATLYPSFLMSHSMAKKRSMKGYHRVNVDKLITVGALTTDTVLEQGLTPDGAIEPSIVTSVDLHWGITGHTAGEGPLVVGVAHNDYSAAEIQEFLENVTSWDTGDMISQEKANRKIRVVGEFPGAEAVETLNDGKSIKTKLNWKVEIGSTLDAWIFNKDQATLTSGTILLFNGKINVFPA